MSNDTFRAIARAMTTPAFYPHPVGRIRVRETHISLVFLTGEHVYKLKKPVDLGFLDFRALERRRHFCLREVEVNRRLAEGVYRGVVSITREGAGFRLGGAGEAVEYAVHMRQLRDEDVLEERLRQGGVPPDVVVRVAEHLADFLRRAEPLAGRVAGEAYAHLHSACAANFRQVAEVAGADLDPLLLGVVQSATMGFLRHRQDLFQRRAAQGWVRDGHGDLRTGHIYIENGAIRVIDALEFNDDLRRIDTASDLAFLAMDLDARRRPDLAELLLETAARALEDPGLYALLPFYQCYRAMVRCKVSVLRRAEPGLDRRQQDRLLGEARGYLALAGRYALQFGRPRVWVTAGLPASGKSTLARGLGEALGLAPLRSDVLRRELFGAAQGPQPFGAGRYHPAALQRVYGRLLTRAGEHLARGSSVVLDATFGRRRARGEARRLARDRRCGIVFLECTAPEETLRQRLLRREGRQEVSDARIEHLEALRAEFEPLSELEPHQYLKLDTSGAREGVLRRALAWAYHGLRTGGPGALPPENGRSP